MEEAATTNAVIEHPAAPRRGAGPGSEMDISGRMVLWTWATFFLAAIVLYKIAWKPILAALDRREKGIRDALDGAEEARAEAASLRESHERMVAEAEAAARAIAESGRKAAEQSASAIQMKAKREAEAMVTQAKKEIGAAQEKAAEALRKESAQLAVAIAQKLLEDKANEARDRELAERLAKEL